MDNSNYAKLGGDLLLRRINGKSSLYHTKNHITNALNRNQVKLILMLDGQKTISEIINHFKSGKSKPEVFIKSLADYLEFSDKPFKKSIQFPEPIEAENVLDSVSISLTAQCTHSCKHCAVNGGTRRSQEMTKEHIFSVLDDCKKMMVKVITLTGGEPFLRKDIFEILEYISSFPVSVFIYTNGLLINRDIASRLAKYGFSISLSIDGSTKTSHDDLRGRKGAFDSAVKAIKILKEHKIKVGVSSVISTKTINEIDSIMSLLKDNGLKNIRLGPMSLARSCDYSDYIIKDDYIDKYYAEYIKSQKTLTGNSKMSIPFKRKNSSAPICNGGDTQVSVLANGDVAPCTFVQSKSYSAGSVFNETLYSIWNNPDSFKEFRNSKIADYKECVSCNFNTHCRINCPPANNYSFKDKMPIYCNLIKNHQEKIIFTNENSYIS